jgi:hypothetical protein
MSAINVLLKTKHLLQLAYMCPVSEEPFRTTRLLLAWLFSLWFESTWTVHIKRYPVLSSKECGTDDIPRLAAMSTLRRTLQEHTQNTVCYNQYYMSECYDCQRNRL